MAASKQIYLMAGPQNKMAVRKQNKMAVKKTEQNGGNHLSMSKKKKE